MEERNNLIDISKAIGIISVIIGHCCVALPIINFPINLFVYTYHIMIFFFVSGFCYNEKKYGDHLGNYVYKKISKLVALFFLYNLFFVLFHNLLVNLSLISAPAYSKTDMFIWIVNGFLMETNESLLGAFWFLPMFLFSNLLFGIEFSFSSTICKKNKNKNKKYFIDFLFILLCIYIAYFAHSRGLFLYYHIQTSCLAIPVIYFGWLVKKYSRYIDKFINVGGLLISFLLICIFIRNLNFRVELSQNIITNIFGFYFLSITGIYFCLSFSKLLLKIRWVNKSLVFIGKNSFHFMALHFLCFKLIDFNVSINTIDVLENRMIFPCTYQFGLVYVVFSILAISLFIMAKDALNKLFLLRKEQYFMKNH